MSALPGRRGTLGSDRRQDSRSVRRIPTRGASIGPPSRGRQRSSATIGRRPYGWPPIRSAGSGPRART